MDHDFFKKQNLGWLKKYLKDKGISVDGRNKAALLFLIFVSLTFLPGINITAHYTTVSGGLPC